MPTPTQTVPVPQSPRDPFIGSDGHIRPLREIKKDAVARALERYSGRKTSAAAALGISKTTFFKMLHDLGLFVPKQRTYSSRRES